MERGTYGIAGGTINLASRFSNIANPGEIVVDVNTRRQVEGHFSGEYRETTTVKGKADTVEVHQVLSQRDKPITIRRLSRMRADLVGRNAEMAELSQAIGNLQQGKGRIFSICGAAGTGKSRLVEEFKAILDLERIQWIEGHACAYSQNMPYFPLIDLLNRLLQIEEKDPPEKVRKKIASGLGSLVANPENVIPYVGQLYSLNYPEANDISPEQWKSRLQTAVLTILSAVAERAPTVFFLEDLHWAEPSLWNLSLSVAQKMLASLLKTEVIPPDLERWVQSKAEGNPLYLEELVNSLIESETLTPDNGSWKLTRSLAESGIPSSLHGLLLPAGSIAWTNRQSAFCRRRR